MRACPFGGSLVASSCIIDMAFGFRCSASRRSASRRSASVVARGGPSRVGAGSDSLVAGVGAGRGSLVAGVGAGAELGGGRALLAVALVGDLDLVARVLGPDDLPDVVAGRHRAAVERRDDVAVG